ncbi:MAG: ABC transporter substrate-binding protein [Desulfovibrionaceae bacterium]|nr:ABC transporter substrate-binding protein [Desulfovibrionaceae bacterium]MBF0514937.1 ABC transporter substrate-binding protein [Desulfovibrionaceae bacterium]
MRYVFVLLLSLLLAAAPALAAMAGGPRMTLEQSIDAVIGILKNPGMAGQDKDKPRRVKLIEAIDGVFDAAELARRAVTRDWDKFTPDQKTRFTEAFARLLERTYMDRIESYTDQQVEYLGETLYGDDKAEVATKIVSKGVDIPIGYRMIKKDGWRVYDVVIEGVSLVQNYRTQFGQILLKETPEQLIGRVANMTAPQAEKK